MAKITTVGRVLVPVADQDAGIKFYTQVLGFTLSMDEPFGEGSRWVEVAPPGADTTIALAPPPPGQPAGNAQTGIALQTRDIDAVYADLKADGVDVDDEVSRMGDPVPPLLWFRDPDNNTLMVVETA